MHVMVVLQIIRQQHYSDSVFAKVLDALQRSHRVCGYLRCKESKSVDPLQKTCWASMSLWPLYCCAALYLPVMERDFRLSLRSSIDPR